MTIDSTLNIASMMQSYRQLNAAKKENEEAMFDSVEASNAAAQAQSINFNSMIAEMKQAWLEDSKLTYTKTPEEMQNKSFEEMLSNYFDYDKESFRDSYGILSFDEISRRRFNLLQQNPRYADAVNYQYAMFSDENTTITGNVASQVQINLFLSSDEINSSIIDKGYSRADFDNAAQIIESMLDNVLKEQFEKDPDSKETSVLLLLKAKLQAMPEIIEQIRDNAIDFTRKSIEQDNEKAFKLALYTADSEVASELQIFHDIGETIKQYLSPEQQEQFAELEDVIVNYYQNNWNKSFAFRGFDPITQYALAEAKRTLNENFKKVAVEDDADTLLELGTENRTDYASIVDYEITRENVLSRAKKKTKDDSLLQQLMGGKTNNQAKVTGASV